MLQVTTGRHSPVYVGRLSFDMQQTLIVLLAWVTSSPALSYTLPHLGHRHPRKDLECIPRVFELETVRHELRHELG